MTSVRDPHVMELVAMLAGGSAAAAERRARELLPDEADAAAALGSALHRHGRWVDALTSLRRALALRPGDVRALVEAADCLRELGQTVDSITVYQEALRLDRHQPEVLDKLGDALMQTASYDEAIVAYRLACELQPESAEMQLKLTNAQTQLAVRRISTLMEQRRFDTALDSAMQLARTNPHARDCLLAIAVCQRMLSRPQESLATLERLQQAHPRFGRQYQERGYCHLSRQDTPAAAEAFSRAVELNPALLASWGMLEKLYRAAGQRDAEQQAAAQVAALQRLPQAVLLATSLFHDDDLGPAEQSLRVFIARDGEHPDALRLLGRIALRRGVPEDARVLFARVLAQAPDHRATRYDHARALMALKKHHAARAELATLVRLDPANRSYLTLYASACGASGDHEEAVRIYRQLIGAGGTSPGVHQWLGNALKALGRSEEAIDAYRTAVRMQPDLGIAYWSLADLKTYRFTDDEFARMKAVVDAPSTSAVDRYHLCFALGKALEDRGEYAASFDCYARGNLLKRSENTYQPAPEKIAARQIETCTAAFLSSRDGVGCRSPDPIFIVGLPRSGSTLLEQILASHSRVDGTRELTELPALVFELQGRNADPSNPRYPGVLRDLGAADFQRLGERYLAETRVHRAGRPFFIDKLSGNFRHIGLIHLILPNAKIIDARREPMACCFGNFKQLFASGQEFSYSLEDLARYYRSYLELMRHWDRVLPGRVLRVHHEDVVDDLEGSVRRLLDFCGLEFEASCVEYHRTVRSVRTASAEQVRRPIFREGLDQWRHYEPWLEPLKAALGDALYTYRDAAPDGA